MDEYEMILLIEDDYGSPIGIKRLPYIEITDDDLLYELTAAEDMEEKGWLAREVLPFRRIQDQWSYIMPNYLTEAVLDTCYHDILIGEPVIERDEKGG